MELFRANGNVFGFSKHLKFLKSVENSVLRSKKTRGLLNFCGPCTSDEAKVKKQKSGKRKAKKTKVKRSRTKRLTSKKATRLGSEKCTSQKWQAKSPREKREKCGSQKYSIFVSGAREWKCASKKVCLASPRVHFRRVSRETSSRGHKPKRARDSLHEPKIQKVREAGSQKDS